MERRRSLPRCEVSTAAQYAEKSVPGPDGIAGELNHALQRRAALHLRNTGSPYRPPFWIWSGLLALALVAGVPAWTLSPACRMATQRVVFPGMPAHYTTVEVRPGDCEIATKTDLEVTVQFGGRPPTDAQVERRDADRNLKADGLTQTGPRSFSYRFQDVRGDFTYRVRGNDALSPDYQVRTYTPPEMAAMEVEIVPPAYAQIPSARSIGGNVTALRGSEL